MDKHQHDDNPGGIVSKVPWEQALIPKSMLTPTNANEGAHAQSALIENGMSPKGGSIEQR